MATRRNGMADLTTYKVLTDESIPRRLAKYLSWCREEAPGRTLPFGMIAKVILQLPRSGTDKDIAKIKQAIINTRHIMESEMGIGLLSFRGIGIRASTDSQDLAMHQYERQARRLGSAAVALDKTRAIINPSEIRDEVVRKRVTEITKVVKVIGADDIIKKLLPPKDKEKSDG